MIAYLKGRVLSKGADSIILLVNDIGYKVFLAAKPLEKVSEGENLELFCSTHAKQNETLELYGVSSLEGLSLFEMFRGIPGIGPKAALTLCSLGSREDFQKAIQEKDEKFFAGTRGIGRKKIQKILVEMSGKLESISFVSRKRGEKQDEALSALTNLGFSRRDAKEALSHVPEDVEDTQERMKAALKLLGK